VKRQPAKPVPHQPVCVHRTGRPVPELAAALAMPPEKRCRKTNQTARKTNGWAMGARTVTH
jgi:hypothetical protein